MKKTRTHRCSCCNKPAVWMYAPASTGRVFYCNDCVPRGCSCNVDTVTGLSRFDMTRKHAFWSKEDYEKYHATDELMQHASPTKQEDSFYVEVLDDEGRRNPCCEFWWSEGGYEIEENAYWVDRDVILDVLQKMTRKLPYTIQQELIDKINALDSCVEYRSFMRKIYDFLFVEIPSMEGLPHYPDNALKFYRSFRDRVFRLKRMVTADYSLD